ncbi:MAG TPA: ethanolamine ammonia-lyase subunit EutC [Candidatus Binataceae bacterium]|nr:ethanolamine ammonia-lyase subunit EutC [Candidatus Binataceae bacterium]
MESRRKTARAVARHQTARAAEREFAAMARATPARLGVGRAGPRYTTESMLQFRADHARAVDAVRTEVPAGWAKRNGMIEVRSRALTRETYLLRPELGRLLAPADAARLAQKFRSGRTLARGRKPRAIICVGDGLSSTALEAGAAPLVRALREKLRHQFTVMPPLFVRNARVRIEDQIGEIVRPDVICMIIGERPGLATAESLSAYILWRPRLSSREPDRTVISNIHSRGLTVAQAASKIASLIADAARVQATGAVLAQALARGPAAIAAGGGRVENLV